MKTLTLSTDLPQWDRGPKMKYTYRDFVTRKMKFTRGKFSHWTRGGILNAWYAVFVRRSSVLYIPEHCLTKDTFSAITLRKYSSKRRA